MASETKRRSRVGSDKDDRRRRSPHAESAIRVSAADFPIAQPLAVWLCAMAAYAVLLKLVRVPTIGRSAARHSLIDAEEHPSALFVRGIMVFADYGAIETDMWILVLRRRRTKQRSDCSQRRHC
jgi:hypothetical protein